MFSSGSFSSISFATVTPSLVIVGDPNYLSRMTLRPFGPSVTLTALARLFDPAQDRLPRRVAVGNLFGHLQRPAFSGSGRIDRRQHVVFLHDQVVHAVELDLLAGVLAEQDRVAGLDVERHAFALVVRPCRRRRRSPCRAAAFPWRSPE